MNLSPRHGKRVLISHPSPALKWVSLSIPMLDVCVGDFDGRSQACRWRKVPSGSGKTWANSLKTELCINPQTAAPTPQRMPLRYPTSLNSSSSKPNAAYRERGLRPSAILPVASLNENLANFAELPEMLAYMFRHGHRVSVETFRSNVAILLRNMAPGIPWLELQPPGWAACGFHSETVQPPCRMMIRGSHGMKPWSCIPDPNTRYTTCLALRPKDVVDELGLGINATWTRWRCAGCAHQNTARHTVP